MEIEELFRKRLLRRVNFDIEKVKSSIKIAELKLEEAKKLFLSSFFNNAIGSPYVSAVAKIKSADFN